MKPLAWVSRVPMAEALGAALLLGAGFGAITTARGQDQSAATAKDVIFARKILMGSIGDNMDELEGIIESGKIDVQHGASHADLVSVMMLAFPHLFPATSNEWKPNVDKDPGTDTFAAPEIWTRYADFYQRAAGAAKSAYNASRARDGEEFKKHVIELRAGCDGCHAAYQKKD